MTVNVEMDEGESSDDEETEDYKWDEPAAKRLKVMQNIKQHKNEIVDDGDSSELFSNVHNTCIEVTNHQGFGSEKNLQQILAQTIINAFYQCKQVVRDAKHE